MKRCKFTGCNRAVKAKGYCNTHYVQLQRGQKLRRFKPNPNYKCSVRGAKHKNWKGGMTTQRFPDGSLRVLVFKPEHPHATPRGYVLRSRLVMEKKIGRYLRTKERVHHKDRNTLNDRTKNLELFAGNKEHLRLHHQEDQPISGERNHHAKLNNHQVLEMRRLKKAGYTYPKTIKKLGIQISQAEWSNICNRKRWKHLP